MLDGVVAQGRQGLAFRGAQVDEACVERVQALVRQRVLGLFERRRLLSRAALYGHRPEQQQQRSIELRLSASEFLDRVAALIPPPRKLRHRYFGVLVPKSPWRAQVVAQAGRKPGAGSKAPRPKTVRTDFGATRAGHPARYLWAQLLARIYGVFALKCSGCGGRMRLVGFITEPATVRQILEHVGEPTSAPAIAPAR